MKYLERWGARISSDFDLKKGATRLTRNWLFVALTFVLISFVNEFFWLDSVSAINTRVEAIRTNGVLYKRSAELQTQLLQEKDFVEEAYPNEDKELQKARETLIDFFDCLHDGKYDKAVLLFEPREEGPGMQGSSWKGLAIFNLPEDRNDRAKVLKRYCEVVQTCLKVKILNAKRVADDEYKLKVEFLNDDGSTFVYSCCGSTSSQTEFDYFVQKINGVYKVRTPPLFRP